MPTLVSQLHKTSEFHGDQIAISFGETQITYKLLHEAVLRLAQGLVDLGIQKGDRVAIMLPNVPHFCISYFGVLQAGGTVVPINIMFNEEEITYHLQDCGAKVLITWEGFQDKATKAFAACDDCKEMLILGDNIPQLCKPLTQIISDSQPLAQAVDIQENDIAVINYTSGVAKQPLGAEFTHNTIYANALNLHEMFCITESDKLIAVLPLFHPLGQTLILNASITAASTIFLVPKFEPQPVIDLIQQEEITILAAVPGMFSSMVNNDIQSTALHSIKLCLSYGGKLANDLLEAFQNKYDTPILESYGLTEAGPLVASNRLDREPKAGSVGLPVYGVEVQIRNEKGEQLRPNRSGEIFIKSSNLMEGYLGQEEETAKRKKDNWLSSGDFGYLDDQHYLFVQERKEDIIIKGGFQIFPREIEKLLLEHDDIKEAAIVGVYDRVLGSEVKAYIVMEDGKTISQENLFNYCHETFPYYKCPKYVDFIEELPKSPTGRVLRRVLRERNSRNNGEQ